MSETLTHTQPIDPFSLEQFFTSYLKRVELDPETMPAAQLKETKHAFMAGCGDMLMTLIHEVSDLSDQEAASAVDRMVSQVEDYFMEEAADYIEGLEEKAAKAVEFILK